MTNRNLTALVIRIAGIFLFIKIFDHFGAYFLSVHGITMMTQFAELLKEPIDELHFAGTLLIIVNIVVSLFLFLKAEWISKKLIKTDKVLNVELTPKSLAKVILMTVGIVWLATSVCWFPYFIEYWIELISKMNGNENADVPDIAPAKYVIRTIIALILIFRIEKVSNWITKRI